MAKPLSIKDKITYGFAATIFLLLMIGFVMMYFIHIPEENKEAVNTCMNKLEDAFFIVVAYLFGSSMGSKEKTEMLKNSQVNNENMEAKG